MCKVCKMKKKERLGTKKCVKCVGFLLANSACLEGPNQKNKKLANPSLTHVIKNLKILNCMYTGMSKCMCNLDYMQHDM